MFARIPDEENWTKDLIVSTASKRVAFELSRISFRVNDLHLGFTGFTVTLYPMPVPRWGAGESSETVAAALSAGGGGAAARAEVYAGLFVSGLPCAFVQLLAPQV